MALVPIFVLIIVLALASCGGGGAPAKTEAPVAAAAPPAAAPAADDRPVIVAFGDSLSAGYGLEAGLSYPDFLQGLLDARGHRYRVVNQGLSGDTTSGGLSRLDQCIALKPRIVLLELGGNDGLRGLPVAGTRKNLDEMITRLQAAGSAVALIGITLPRNYGDAYIKGFESNYVDLARRHSLTLVPFLFEGIWAADGGKPGMIQEDGIHPTAKGTPVMAETVYRGIRKLL